MGCRLVTAKLNSVTLWLDVDSEGVLDLGTPEVPLDTLGNHVRVLVHQLRNPQSHHLQVGVSLAIFSVSLI